MILVTGATGNVGGRVLRRLVERGEPVRALTRDPAAARFPAGVEVAEGAPGDAEAVGRAIEGVDAVFAVFVGDVAAQAQSFAKAVQAAGTRRVVLLSSSSVVHPVRHKIGDEHHVAEKEISAAAPEWTVLRPGPFHTNALWWANSVRETGRARCLVGNRPGAPIDPDDVASIAVLALTEDGHAGTTYELTGPQVLTSGDLVRVLARVSGRPIEFEVATADEAVAAFVAAGSDPESARSNIAALHSRQVPWAYANPTAERLLGRPPRRFHDWAAENAAAFA